MHGGLLPDDPTVEILLEGPQSLELTGDEVSDRNAGPGSHDVRDLLLTDDDLSRLGELGQLPL
jgi:hypothetical protein